jgi:hypothetical protein
MAKVNLDWSHIEFKASEVSGWVALRKAVKLDEHPDLFSNRAVYVIRISRPFAFQYPKGYSPVAYIGKGRAQQRLTSHLKSWIKILAKKIPDLTIRIYYCEPRVRRLGRICEGVEADLIQRFVTRYGQRPLRNRNTPTKSGVRHYSQAQLHILHPRQGP